MSETTTSLGPKAFNVFCDVAAKDAVAKNNRFREVNAALQAVQKEVNSIQILRLSRTEQALLYACDIRALEDSDVQSTDDETKLTCSVGDALIELPLDDLPRLRFRVSGVGVNTGGWFGKMPELWVSHDTVGIRVDYSKALCIEGKVENYGGALEDIQRLIDTNRVCHHWRYMGAFGARTGQPVGSRVAALGEDYLDGATFRLEKLRIATQLVEPLLDSATPSHQHVEEDEELKDLTTVVPFHKELRQATADRERLRAENFRLSQARDHYQSFCITSPEVCMDLKLNQGHGGTLFKDDHAAWTLEPPEGVPMHLTSISKIRITLANVPISSLLGPLYAGEPMFSGDGLMILQYGGGIEIVFSFDESIENVDQSTLQTDLFSHVQVTLLMGNSFREGRCNQSFGLTEFRMTTEEGQVVRPLTEVTMRLLWVSVRLEAIQAQLELLGIETSTIGAKGTWKEEERGEEQADVEEETGEEEEAVEEIYKNHN